MSIVSLNLSSNKLHSVHSSSISAWGLIFLPNFQKGGAWQDQFSDLSISEGGCWETQGWLFSGEAAGYSFYIKNKLKSEIFNDKNGL